MQITFDQPVFLGLLLLAIPLIVIGWRTLLGFDALRRIVVLIARTAVIALVAIILAGPRLRQEHDQLTVIGVLDVSDSVRRFAQIPDIQDITSASNIERLRQWFRAATQERGPDDRFGLVVFDGRAIAIAAPTRGDYPDDNLDVTIREGTNIAEAIQLALAMFPGDTSKRIVLATDGNETLGDALAAARDAAGATIALAGNGNQAVRSLGVPIDVLPLAYRVERDVQIVRIEAPPNARPEQVVTVRILLDSIEETHGDLSLVREEIPIDLNGSAAGYARRIAVPAGRSVQLAQVRLGAEPVNQFEAAFEPLDPRADSLAENNRAEAFIATPSKGRVLIARSAIREGEWGDADALAATLEASGLPVDVRPAGSVPRDLLDLQAYDLVILQNVAAWDVDPAVHQSLAHYVSDFGGGLIMLGGEQSFGAGGWNGTALEEVLPVELDLPKEMRRTQAALVLVLDKSGSMNASVAGARATQQQVANEGAARAIESLQPDSLVGVITFDSFAHELVPLAPNDDPIATARTVRGIVPNGGTNMGPALERARRMLNRVDTRIKHVVCLSDGQSAGAEDLGELVAQMRAEGITVSTIAVGDSADFLTLESLAEIGKGTFYQVINAASLPRVLIDSVKVVNRPLIKEVVFDPVARPTGSSLSAVMISAPALEGLVLTAPRDDPTISLDLVTPENEPLLAHWQVGIGRAAAFTSDAHLDWSRRWSNWPGYGTFFTQLARTISRSPVTHEFELTTNVDRGRLDLTLDAVAEDDRAFLDHLVVAGRIYGPDGAATEVRLDQIGPGRYTGSVPTHESGNYIVALLPRLGDRTLAPVIGGVSIPAGAELRRYRSNMALLQDIAKETGGRLLDLSDPLKVDLYDRSGMGVSTSLLPVWKSFLYVLIPIFLMDVSARRLAWDARTLRHIWLRALGRAAPRYRKADEAQVTLASLLQRSAEVDDTIARESASFEKLEGRRELRIPAHLRPATRIEHGPRESKEDRAAAALARLKGKPRPERKDEPKPPATQGPHDDGTTSRETASGLRDAKRRARERFTDER